MKKNFMNYDRESQKVELTLSFNVSPYEEVEPFKTPEVDITLFLTNIVDAVALRMQHCQNELTNFILPQEDKVFTESAIYSNCAGKRFSIFAYEAMEHLLEKIEKIKEYKIHPVLLEKIEKIKGKGYKVHPAMSDIAEELEEPEIAQALKAVSQYGFDKEKKSMLMDILVEMLVVKKQNNGEYSAV